MLGRADSDCLRDLLLLFVFFFFNDTATTEIYTLSLHDALPISQLLRCDERGDRLARHTAGAGRSEEHTSELQSPDHLVCRLLLEKTNLQSTYFHTIFEICLTVSLLSCLPKS